MYSDRAVLQLGAVGAPLSLGLIAGSRSLPAVHVGFRGQAQLWSTVYAGCAAAAWQHVSPAPGAVALHRRDAAMCTPPMGHAARHSQLAVPDHVCMAHWRCAPAMQRPRPRTSRMRHARDTGKHRVQASSLCTSTLTPAVTARSAWSTRTLPSPSQPAASTVAELSRRDAVVQGGLRCRRGRHPSGDATAHCEAAKTSRADVCLPPSSPASTALAVLYM